MESFVIRAIKKIFHVPATLPPFIQLEITNICNLRCEMCPRHHVAFEEEHIDFEVFKKIIDRLDGVSEISLVGLGEPLTYPRFSDAVQYCKSKGLTVKTTTNGLLLQTEENCRQLIDSGLDTISFSLESIGAPEKVHEKAHQNSRVIENISRLLRLKEQSGAETPKITLQAIMIRGREQDLYDIIRWGTEQGVNRINVIRMTMYFESGMERPSEAEERSIFKKLAEFRKRYGIRIDCIQDQFFTGFPGLIYKYSKPFLRLDSHCPRVLDYPYVTLHGDIIPCCSLREFRFGNIMEHSLKELWHGKKISDFRKDHLSIDICSKCDNFRLRQVV